ncbi:MAG: hypothetical protein ACRBBW_16295 [Cellvibrionaceae bacterium]
MIVEIDSCEGCGQWDTIRDSNSVTEPSPTTREWVELEVGGDVYCTNCGDGHDVAPKKHDIAVDFTFVYHVSMQPRRTTLVHAHSTERAVKDLLHRVLRNIDTNTDAYPDNQEQEIYIDSICWLNRGVVTPILDLPEPITYTPKR